MDGATSTMLSLDLKVHATPSSRVAENRSADQVPLPEVLGVASATHGSDLAALSKGEEIAAARAAEEAAVAERDVAARVLEAGNTGRVVFPVSGRITSNFGARWGSTHYGLDVANSVGTPIVSAMDGEVIDSGPASGFGLWVRVQHDDGTVTVYGHINETLVEVGQRVTAGEQIATVGNRGNSTGPHLHFEVLTSRGKTDPFGWLEDNGADT